MDRFEEMELIVRRINAIKRNLTNGYYTATTTAAAEWLLRELRGDLAKMQAGR